MVNEMHFKKWISVMLISAAVFGIVFPAATFYTMGIRDISIIFATGAINMLFSIFFFIWGLLILKKPAISYSEIELEIKNMLGITIKKVSLKDDAVEIKEGKIYVNDEKIRMSLSSLNSKEFSAFVSFITQAKKKFQSPSARQKRYLYN